MPNDSAHSKSVLRHSVPSELPGFFKRLKALMPGEGYDFEEEEFVTTADDRKDRCKQFLVDSVTQGLRAVSSNDFQEEFVTTSDDRKDRCKQFLVDSVTQGLRAVSPKDFKIR